MINWDRLFQPDLIWAVIPIVAILVWGIVTIVDKVHTHRERQAMIEQGIHPDFPPDDRSHRAADRGENSGKHVK